MVKCQAAGCNRKSTRNWNAIKLCEAHYKEWTDSNRSPYDMEDWDDLEND